MKYCGNHSNSGMGCLPLGAVWDPGSDAPFICGAATARVSTVASAEAAAAEGQEVGAACGCGLGGTLGLSFTSKFHLPQCPPGLCPACALSMSLQCEESSWREEPAGEASSELRQEAGVVEGDRPGSGRPGRLRAQPSPPQPPSPSLGLCPPSLVSLSGPLSPIAGLSLWASVPHRWSLSLSL